MKKHFLILMLMALLPMAGFAATFDVTKFVAGNILFGSTTLPAVTNPGKEYYDSSEPLFEADMTHFYTSNEGAGETAVITGTGASAVNNLAKAEPKQYFIKVTGKAGKAYEGQTVYVDFWINKRPVTIKMTADQNKDYGEDDPEEFDYTLTDPSTSAAFDNTGNVLKLSVTRKPGDNAGKYAYVIKSDNASYSVVRDASDEAVFTINPKALSADDAKVFLSVSKLTFNGERQAPTVTVKTKADNKELEGEWALTYWKGAEEIKDGSKAVKPINAGTYTIKVASLTSGTTVSNYTITGTLESDPFVIEPAPLNVYANDLSKAYDGEYDDSDPTASIYGGTATAKVLPSVSFGGLKGADATVANPFGEGAFTVTYADLTTVSANVGSYNLVPVKGTVNEAYANYKPTLAKTGKLTITQQAITVKADDKEKGLGEDDPTFSITVTGGVASEVASIKKAYKVTREADETTGAKTLTLAKLSDEELGVVDGATTDAAKAAAVKKYKGILANYDITEKNGTLTIGAGTLLVYPKSVAVTYGTATPTFEVVATTPNGTVIELSTKPTVKFGDKKYAEKAPTAVGIYELVLDGDAVAEGYTITKTTGQYTISKKDVEVTCGDQNLVVGKQVKDLDDTKITFTGLVDGDKIQFSKAFGTGIVTDTEGKIASSSDNTTGTYSISIAAGTETAFDATKYANKNYNFKPSTTVTGKLIVGKGAAAGTTINFTSEDADYATITANSGKTLNVTLAIDARNDRQVPAGTVHTWKAETWNTMVLPFDVTVAQLSKAFGYCVVNRVNPEKTTEGNVVFKLEMKKVPANEPFCVKTAADVKTTTDDTKLKFENVKIVAPANEYPSVDAGQGYKFIGAYKGMTIDKTKSALYFLRGDTEKWAHITSSSANSWAVLPFDAYVDQSGSASARELTFTFEEADGTTTSIRAIEASADKSAVKTGWYTLGGVKLNNAPAQKGVYINNGKKVVVK